jgi:hypothetical protein
MNYKHTQEIQMLKLKNLLISMDRPMDFAEISIYAQENLYLPEIAVKKRLALWVQLNFVIMKNNSYQWNKELK